MEKYQIVKKGNRNNAMAHVFQQALFKCRTANLIVNQSSGGIVILGTTLDIHQNQIDHVLIQRSPMEQQSRPESVNFMTTHLSFIEKI